MYHLILQNMDAGGINHPGKRFSIFPIFGMQSQHVIVDQKVLKKIMVETGDIHEGMSDNIFKANIVQHFDRVFNTDKLRQSGQLGRDFSTHFPSRRMEWQCRLNFCDRLGSDEQRQFRDDGAAEPDPDEGTWGIDPGVNNILYAVRQIREDELEHKVLSRKRYYRDAGVDRAKKVTRRARSCFRLAAKLWHMCPSRRRTLTASSRTSTPTGPTFKRSGKSSAPQICSISLQRVPREAPRPRQVFPVAQDAG